MCFGNAVKEFEPGEQEAHRIDSLLRCLQPLTPLWVIFQTALELAHQVLAQHGTYHFWRICPAVLSAQLPGIGVKPAKKGQDVGQILLDR